VKAFQEFIDVIKRGNFVVLDTETTGLRFPAEIIEIAIIDPNRKVLLNTRVKPVNDVPADATRIHGITAADLVDCPSWPEVRKDMISIITGKDVVIYNASYDFGMFHNSDRVSQVEPPTYYDDIADFYCAMLWYAEHWGEWDDYRGGYRWKKLTDACHSLSISTEGAHGALGDCLMTIKVIETVIGDIDSQSR